MFAHPWACKRNRVAIYRTSLCFQLHIRILLHVPASRFSRETRLYARKMYEIWSIGAWCRGNETNRYNMCVCSSIYVDADPRACIYDRTRTPVSRIIPPFFVWQREQDRSRETNMCGEAFARCAFRQNENEFHSTVCCHRVNIEYFTYSNSRSIFYMP